MPIADIRARHVLQVVRSVESRGAGETAARTLQRIKSVFRYAVREDLIESNPTLDVLPDEVLKPRKVTHRPALPEAELPSFLATLDFHEGDYAKHSLQGPSRHRRRHRLFLQRRAAASNPGLPMNMPLRTAALGSPLIFNFA